MHTSRQHVRQCFSCRASKPIQDVIRRCRQQRRLLPSQRLWAGNAGSDWERGHVLQADGKAPDDRPRAARPYTQPRPSGRPPPDSEDGWLDRLVEWLMPQERGDSRDMALMALSISVFVWISAHLYHVYAMYYYASSLRPVSHFMR